MTYLDTMLEKALAAREKAYAPYSQFLVGACLLSSNGHYYTGCNVENASYGLCICAEASAICQMVIHGEQIIKEALIVGTGNVLCSPCGACRQRLFEFAPHDVIIHMGNQQGHLQTTTLSALLPAAFGPNNLEHP